MKHIALKIEFKTDKFKLTGPLPEEINAGNQFGKREEGQVFCLGILG